MMGRPKDNFMVRSKAFHKEISSPDDRPKSDHNFGRDPLSKLTGIKNLVKESNSAKRSSSGTKHMP